MIRTLRTAVVAALLLAAGNAWALGLGQIEVKSRRNQPLLAEIPIVSTTPGELAELKARLASPDTFRRVGLSPPSGIAADLQFSLGKDAKGRPVIRVTTLKPVDQAVLNFLIEVDWGQGRLVREYSALVDVPNEVNSPLLPAIQAPQAPASNLIRRAEPAPAPVQAPPAAVEAAAAPIAAQPVLATPAAEAPAAGTEIRPFPMQQPAAPPSPAPVVAPVPAAAADTARQYGPVKRGETLSAITGKLGLGKAFSLDQSMLALLRANPDAFLGDDVNQLRSGAVLRVPERDQIAQIDADEAAQVVRQQMQQWRQARRAVSQPAAMPATSTQQATAKPAGAAQPPAARKPAPKAPAATAAQANATAVAKPVRREDARLQIVPPAAPGKAAGTKSGTSAGGEGSMLQQQLRQRDEDIATKSAEIGELKARVAALEKLKEDQQQLISMKDSELAAAQQRLAEANKAAAQVKVPQAAAAKPPAPAAQAPADAPTQHGAMPYVWGGAGFAALALLAWVLARRNRQAPPPRRRVFDSEALAASMAPAGQREDAQAAPELADPDMADAPVADAPEGRVSSSVTTVIDLASVPPAPPRMDAPAWHSGWVKSEPPVSQAAPSVAQDAVTPPPVEASGTAQDAPASAPAPAPVVTAANLSEPPAQASAEQRFKLVRAFLDMGDDYSAQQLLLELLDDPDEKVGDEAARMLSKLAG